ncbi:MAG: hypothetical protein QOI21_5154 [Actinomycetota bacterium]|jgi:hypothetical protein|nr:hypothetical protein [Actinomycetota bacterium]
MTQATEIPVQEFVLRWTLPGARGGRVGFEISGQVSLLHSGRFYKIDGVLYVAEGSTYSKEIGNPRLSVLRNGVEASGRHWGWETVAKKSCARLCTFDNYFVRTGYWAPSDRAIQLKIGADFGWGREKTHSPTVTVRMVD